MQPTCPVCRVSIEDDVEPLRKCRPPSDLSNAPHFELTAELKVLQAKMANLFQRQKNRGGIIEVGAEESNVISIDDEEPEVMADKQAKDSPDDQLSGTPRMSAHQRVTCRNHRQIQPAPVAAPAKPAVVERKEAKREDSDEEEEEDGRHRRHHHHHDHHRRGGNRHNRRRQYHTSHSQSQDSSSNGQTTSTGSSSTR